MNYLRVAVACFVLLPPLSLPAQRKKLAITSCVDADSVLGPLTKDQSSASLTRYVGPMGVSTSIERIERGGISLHFGVLWTDTTIAEPVGAQLVSGVPVKAMAPAGTVNVTLLIDDWLSLPLGEATPPVVVNFTPYKMPMREMPMSSLLTEEDLRALATAKSAAIKYGEKRIDLKPSDVAALNALYRTVLCERAAVRKPTVRPT